jgi:tagatose-1,6-bisphosphate aldolase
MLGFPEAPVAAMALDQREAVEFFENNHTDGMPFNKRALTDCHRNSPF